MASSQTIQTRQLNDHSKKIAVIEQQQAEHYRILASIDRKLTPEFFDKIEVMYEYLIIGNGKPSLKAWRDDIDRERAELKSGGHEWKSRAWAIVQGVVLLLAGGFIARLF